MPDVVLMIHPTSVIHLVRCFKEKFPMFKINPETDLYLLSFMTIIYMKLTSVALARLGYPSCVPIPKNLMVGAQFSVKD